MKAVLETIRERGFRPWYERELIRSHLHLVLLLLATVGLLGALEAMGDLRREGHAADFEAWEMLACLIVAAAVGAWAMRRYLFHLARAEHLAHQAVCPSCGTYARFTVQRLDTPPAGSAAEPALEVCCRQCSHRWRLGG